jgi:hypothetical protein
VITSENWIVHFDLKRLCFLRELNLYTSSNFIFLIFLKLIFLLAKSYNK